MPLESPFSQGDSPLHRAEQRTKIVAALLLSFTAAMVQSLDAALLCFGAGAAATLTARLPLWTVVRSLAPANGFFLFLLVTLPLTYPGTPWPPLPLVSQEGFWLALTITVKGNAVILTVFAFLATNSTSALAAGLSRLGTPQTLVLLLSFVHRQAFLSLDELRRMRRAAQMRCFESRLELRTFQTYAHIIVQTLLRSLDRADRINDAMAMRGFDGAFRSLQLSRSPAGADFLLAGLAALVSGVVAAVDQGWLP